MDHDHINNDGMYKKREYHHQTEKQIDRSLNEYESLAFSNQSKTFSNRTMLL